MQQHARLQSAGHMDQQQHAGMIYRIAPYKDQPVCLAGYASLDAFKGRAAEARGRTAGVGGHWSSSTHTPHALGGHACMGAACYCTTMHGTAPPFHAYYAPVKTLHLDSNRSNLGSLQPRMILAQQAYRPGTSNCSLCERMQGPASNSCACIGQVRVFGLGFPADRKFLFYVGISPLDAGRVAASGWGRVGWEVQPACTLLF